jgi:hypothetical protein
MTSALFIALACALVAATVALVREYRLRKSLQRLLRYLLTHWRKHASTTTDTSRPLPRAGINGSDDRLQ